MTVLLSKFIASEFRNSEHYGRVEISICITELWQTNAGALCHSQLPNSIEKCQDADNFLRLLNHND